MRNAGVAQMGREPSQPDSQIPVADAGAVVLDGRRIRKRRRGSLEPVHHEINGRRGHRCPAPLLEEKLTCPQQPQIYDLLFHGRLARQDLAGAADVLDDPVLGDLSLPFATSVHFWRAELAEAKHDGGTALRERWLAALVVNPDEAGPALDYANQLLARGDLPGALVALRTLSSRARGEARGAIEAKITELRKQRELNRAAAGQSGLH